MYVMPFQTETGTWFPVDRCEVWSLWTLTDGMIMIIPRRRLWIRKMKPMLRLPSTCLAEGNLPTSCRMNCVVADEKMTLILTWIIHSVNTFLTCSIMLSLTRRRSDALTLWRPGWGSVNQDRMHIHPPCTFNELWSQPNLNKYQTQNFPSSLSLVCMAK